MAGNRKQTNPWLGLNSYQEGQTLYGRSAEIRTLSQCIMSNIQTVLYGRSGIGKSSIINAGIFPIARKSGLLPVSIRLEHNGDPYIQQIASGLREAVENIRKDSFNENGDRNVTFEKGNIVELVPVKCAGQETLWEYFHRHKFYDASGTRVIPLIVFDQFEEIFTLEKSHKKVADFFAQLADLLNGVVPEYIAAENEPVSEPEQSEISADSLLDSIRLSMVPEGRDAYLDTSDFRMVFTLREDFLSYLERSTTGIPVLRQNRYCLLPINEEQASLIIMNPVPGLVSPDVARKILVKVIGDDDFTLGSAPTRQVDSAILSLYLSRLYEKMDDESDSITTDLVESVSDNIIEDFYNDAIKGIPDEVVHYLEDTLLNDDERRENISLYKAMSKGGLTDVMLKVLHDERKLLRLFSYGGNMRIEFVHDILGPVVMKRRTSRELLRMQAIEEEKVRNLRRHNRALIFFIVLSVISGLVLWSGMRLPIEHRYTDLCQVDTWYQGINPVSKEDAEHLPYHYVLKKRGWFPNHPYTELTVYDGYGNMTSEHNVGILMLDFIGDEEDPHNDKILQQMNMVCRWVFMPDITGEYIMQEQGYDKDGILVYCYNRSTTDRNDTYISFYSDAFGFPLAPQKHIRVHFREKLDETGLKERIEFFDDSGYPIKNVDGVFAVQYEYVTSGVQKGLLQKACYLNPAGHSMENRYGAAEIRYTYDGFRMTEMSAYDKTGIPCRLDQHSHSNVFAYDEYGRVVETSFWGKDGRACAGQGDVHGVRYGYNENGKVVYKEFLDEEGTPCLNEDGIIRETMEYDQWGNLVMRSRYYADESFHDEYLYNAKGLLSEACSYLVSDGDTTDILIKKTDFAENKTITWVKDEYCLKSVYDYKGRTLTRAYFDPYDFDRPIMRRTRTREFHKVVTMYEDISDVLTHVVAASLDVDGDTLSKRDYVVDSLQNRITGLWYVKDSPVINYIWEYDEGFSNLLREKTWNNDRELRDSVANHGFSVFSMSKIFKAKPESIKKDEDGEAGFSFTGKEGRIRVYSGQEIGWVFVNEAQMPTYMNDADQIYHARMIDEDGTVHYYDEYFNDVQIDSLSGYYRIMILDPDKALQYGFVGGDVLAGPPVELQDSRTMFVYRYDFDEERYKVRRISMPLDEDPDSVIGFSPVYVSGEEEAAFINAAKRYNAVVFVSASEGPVFDRGLTQGVLLKFNDWTYSPESVSDNSWRKALNEQGAENHVVWLDFATNQIMEAVIGDEPYGFRTDIITRSDFGSLERLRYDIRFL